MINCSQNTKNPKTEIQCEIVYSHGIDQLIEGYQSVKVQKQNGQAIFELEVRNYEVQSLSSYLLKLRSNSLKECFQKLFDDGWSTTEPYGRCLITMLALTWSVL